MAHPATKKYSYWGQLGILIGMLGAGLLVGIFVSSIPLLGKLNLGEMKGISNKEFMNSILKPENASAIRWMQFILTLFIFFLPAWFYAKVCHKTPSAHLGFIKRPDLAQIGVAILIMLACLPLIGALEELMKMIPFSKPNLEAFKLAEDNYNKQVAIMARMNGVGDFIASLFIVALLPAVFEETIFRGAFQNLLSRWTKMPVLSVIITAIIFSYVHGSYIGFFPRFFLGFVLGWMFYRTGNIWLNIIAHFINNALALTALYAVTKRGEKMDISKADQHFPIWMGLFAIAALIGLFVLFDKVSRKDINMPGEEVPISGYIDSDNPFLLDIEYHNPSQHS